MSDLVTDTTTAVSTTYGSWSNWKSIGRVGLLWSRTP